MKERDQLKKNKQNIESVINKINGRIESLKTQFNLYFSGEIRIPPETEREKIEKEIRKIMVSEYRSPRIKFLIQNLSSSFLLYNSHWKKKLNEIETGLVKIEKKKTYQMQEHAPQKKLVETLDISLNSEESFEKFFEKYKKILKKGNELKEKKETIINSLKSKMISLNVIDAKVTLSVNKGKMKLKIKT
jgi:hypothetical protein